MTTNFDFLRINDQEIRLSPNSNKELLKTRLLVTAMCTEEKYITRKEAQVIVNMLGIEKSIEHIKTKPVRERWRGQRGKKSDG